MTDRPVPRAVSICLALLVLASFVVRETDGIVRVVAQVVVALCAFLGLAIFLAARLARRRDRMFRDEF